MRWKAKQAQDRLTKLLEAEKRRRLMALKEPKPEEKPLLFSSEPIVGYRAFGWGSPEDTGVLFDLMGAAPEEENPFVWARRKRLRSVAYGTVWPELTEMVAVCLNHGRHPVASKDCGCGLWALKEKEMARTYAGNYGVSIVAEVALWGHFIEHANGWRGQYGYPQRIFVLEPGDLDSYGWKHEDYLEWAKEVAELYAIPAEVWKEPAVGRPAKKGRYSPPSVFTFTATSAVAFPATTATTASTNFWYSTAAAAAPGPSYPWPDKIVHPSELYPTIELQEQTKTFLPELPF